MKTRKLVRSKKKSWKKLEKNANIEYSRYLERKSLNDAAQSVAPDFVLDRTGGSQKKSVSAEKTSVDDAIQSHRGVRDVDSRLLKRLQKLPPRKVDIRKRFPRESDKTRELDTAEDVWDVKPEAQDEHGIRKWYLEATKQRRVRQPSSLERQKMLRRTRGSAVTSSLPAVPLPDAGASYNPTAGSHRQLMLRVAERQVEEDRETERLERQLRSVETTVTESERMREMEAGLFEDEEEEEEDGEVSAVRAAVQCVSARKTKLQKKKLKRARDRQLAAVQARSTQGQLRQMEQDSLRGLNRALGRRERQQLAKREVKRSRAAARAPRVGQHRLREEEEVVQLPEQLSGSLRTLRPEVQLDRGGVGGVLLEGLVRRGVLEHRVKVRLKDRYKKKVIEKK